MDVKSVPVMEIMSKDPPTLEPIASVEDAAVKMVEMAVGCIIVCDEGHPIGIVTEQDIVRKVVSERRVPSDVKLRDIMSSPIIWIPRHMGIMDAAKEMAKMKLRRLVVMHAEEVVGVVTVQNILYIAPHLIEITKELESLEYKPVGILTTSAGQISGYCENCKAYSDILDSIDGELLCPDCKERRVS
jgi:CBS domain-containing protein